MDNNKDILPNQDAATEKNKKAPVTNDAQTNSTTKHDIIKKNKKWINSKYYGVISFVSGIVALAFPLFGLVMVIFEEYGGVNFTFFNFLESVGGALLFDSIPIVLAIIFGIKAREHDEKANKKFGLLGLIAAIATILVIITATVIDMLKPERPDSYEDWEKAYAAGRVVAKRSCKYIRTSSKYLVCDEGWSEDTNTRSRNVYSFEDGKKIYSTDVDIDSFYVGLDEEMYIKRKQGTSYNLYKITDNGDLHIFGENVLEILTIDNRMVGIIHVGGLEAIMLSENGEDKEILAPENTTFISYNYVLNMPDKIEDSGYFIYKTKAEEYGLISIATGEIKIPAAKNQHFYGGLIYRGGKVALMDSSFNIITDFKYDAETEFAEGYNYLPRLKNKKGGYLNSQSVTGDVFYVTYSIGNCDFEECYTYIDAYNKSGKQLLHSDDKYHSNMIGPQTALGKYYEAVAFYDNQEIIFIANDGKKYSYQLNGELKNHKIWDVIVEDDVAKITLDGINGEIVYKNIKTWESVEPKEEKEEPAKSSKCRINNPDVNTNLTFNILQDEDREWARIKLNDKEIGTIDRCPYDIYLVGEDNFYAYDGGTINSGYLYYVSTRENNN